MSYFEYDESLDGQNLNGTLTNQRILIIEDWDGNTHVKITNDFECKADLFYDEHKTKKIQDFKIDTVQIIEYD